MLSYAELQAIIPHLATRVTGSRVQKLALLAPEIIAIELYGKLSPEAEGASKRWLLLSASVKRGRIHLMTDAPDETLELPQQLTELRRRLRRGFVRQCALLKDDRIVELHIEGKEAYTILMLELIGPVSNLYWLSDERRVIGALKVFADARGLGPGKNWFMPPPAPDFDPGDNRMEGYVGDALHAAVSAAYPIALETKQARATVAHDLRDRALRLLKDEVKKTERALAAANKDLDKHQKKLSVKRDADLLKANLYQLAEGARQVTLTDYDDAGEAIERTLELDPRLSIADNMSKLYARYQKAQRGVDVLRPRVSELGERARTLRSVRQALEDEIDANAETLLKSLGLKLPKVHESGKAQGKQQTRGPFTDLPSGIRPRLFHSIDGWEILVGKGARGNDELTTKIAKGNDWFFHIAEFPGSHVILRDQAGQTPPLETLLDAAHLALHFSKQKDASRASVSYAQKKHVRKPKGAKAGLVVMNQRKTLAVRRDPARLERLLRK